MLTLTERASTMIRRLAEETAPGAVLRIGIQGGGCNGFEYVFDFETVAGPADLRVEQHGVTVVVDPESAPYLEGAEIDFVDSFAEIGDIHEEFERLVAQEQRVIQVQLTTAHELSDAEASEILQQIEAY